MSDNNSSDVTDTKKAGEDLAVILQNVMERCIALDAMYSAGLVGGDLAALFQGVMERCIALGAMSSTMSAPSADVISVATGSVLSSGQPAPSADAIGVAAEVAAPSTAVPRTALTGVAAEVAAPSTAVPRTALTGVAAELRKELRAIDDAWRSRISQEAALSLKRELKATDAAEVATPSAAYGARGALMGAYHAAIGGKELSKELKAIDAEWRSRISQEAALSLKRELKAIDAEWRPRIELSAELKAIDAEWRPRIELSAELKAIDAQYKPENQAGGAPSTALTGVAAEVATPSTAALGV